MDELLFILLGEKQGNGWEGRSRGHATSGMDRVLLQDGAKNSTMRAWKRPTSNELSDSFLFSLAVFCQMLSLDTS